LFVGVLVCFYESRSERAMNNLSRAASLRVEFPFFSSACEDGSLFQSNFIW
jgi:hypothetical protein